MTRSLKMVTGGQLGDPLVLGIGSKPTRIWWAIMSLTLSSLSWKMKIKLHLRISAVHMITIVCFNLTALIMRLFTNPDCMRSRRDSTNNWKGLERILTIVLKHYFYTLDTMAYPEGRCSGSSRRTATMLWWQTVSEEMMCMQFCSAFILEISLLNDDAYFKVSPVFENLNKTGKWIKLIASSGAYSVEEIMVPYYGRHSSKQFIRGKPIRFGCKVNCFHFVFNF